MRVLICSLCALFLSFVSGLAETFTVQPDGGGDYATIQEGINAAQDGDVIELTDGTFTGDGNRDLSYLGKSITVRSQSGDPVDVTIDCEADDANQHRAFIFENGEGPGAVLEGITVTHGCHIWGSGLAIWNGSPMIRNCIFEENETAASEGGGLFVATNATIEDCIFRNNTSLHGGGVSVCFCFEGGPTIARCTFAHNTASEAGGGIYI